MILSEYIEKLQKIEKDHGEDLKVVYSIDDEGNAYHEIFYAPSEGYYSKNEFSPIGIKGKINSVCLN